MPRMRDCLILLPGILGLHLVGCDHKGDQKEPPPVKVQVMEVLVEDVPVYREWIGSIQGAQNSQVEARVSGYLMTQEYEEGGQVDGGTVLFRIDPRPYQAALAQAEAQLAEAQAKAELAKITLERQTELFETEVISAQEFDVATQTAQADVAAVEAAQAAVEAAKLNLEFCTIIAPFQGIVGKATAQIGDLVGPGSVLTTISQIQPIKVVFFISEQEYLGAQEVLETAMKTPIEQRRRVLQVILADGEVYPRKGVFDFLNREVDPRTGTIEVVSLFSNPDGVLRPGQYAKVKVHIDTLKNAIVIPQRAVTIMQGTYYQVAVVDANDTVSIRTVQPGIQTGSNWVITSGLQSGDRVVVEGAQKLRSGSKIDPQPFTPAPTPTPSPTPTPEPIPTPGPTVQPAGVKLEMQDAAIEAASPTPSPAPTPTPSPEPPAATEDATPTPEGTPDATPEQS